MDAPEGEARLSAQPRPRGRMGDATGARACAVPVRVPFGCLRSCRVRAPVPPVVALQRLGWVCFVVLLPSVRRSDLRKASDPASFLALFLVLPGSFGFLRHRIRRMPSDVLVLLRVRM
jgi:hypothetical protein